MIYHILNGDSFAYNFHEADIEGEIIVVREALIEEDLPAIPWENFGDQEQTDGLAHPK